MTQNVKPEAIPQLAPTWGASITMGSHPNLMSRDTNHSGDSHFQGIQSFPSTNQSTTPKQVPQHLLCHHSTCIPLGR